MVRIHTDKLTFADFSTAIVRAGLVGVWVEDCILHGSRQRAHGYEVRLAAHLWSGRRMRNSGHWGAERVGAATYDEHGHWMAQLFTIDPHAVIGPYNGEERFHEQTNDRYRVKECECVA